MSYEGLVGKILEVDGYWEFDDTNLADLPIATADLVNAQESYTLPARATTVPGTADLDNYLHILKVQILNADGDKYRTIRPIDHRQLNLSPDEVFGTDSSGNPTTGVPQFYDKTGDTLFLYPSPATASVTLTAGLKIYYQREPDLFTTSDTTQSPGIAPLYHPLICYMAAIPYCVAHKPERVSWLEKQVAILTDDMLMYYGKREKDTRKRMNMRGTRGF